MRKVSNVDIYSGIEVIEMKSTYKTLDTDLELFAAAVSQVKVYVVMPMNNKLNIVVNSGGMIEKFTPEAVKINGGFYFRDRFEFRTEI
ncbi:hypothetical protein OIN60_14100 [Paenibacillus sp. P96]|uniref:DUF3883 domain-containing protein n=1 Tax=Paenibacillus zeirhizosphaerae TaxID=2987519 RepID=A0ABT9FT40_9BACL|nr:hypothetical protein [Paenibacillus sp. P96]MDP4097904.1 hypothetical protein [Paenibacillus sp. P96]